MEKPWIIAIVCASLLSALSLSVSTALVMDAIGTPIVIGQYTLSAKFLSRAEPKDHDPKMFIGEMPVARYGDEILNTVFDSSFDQAVLDDPNYLETKVLDILLNGQENDDGKLGRYYTVPWAMFLDSQGRAWLNGKYTVHPRKGGTVQMEVIRTEEGYIVDLSACGDHYWTRGGSMANYVGGWEEDAIPVIKIVKPERPG